MVGPQINSQIANPQICGLTFFRFADHIFLGVADLRFADPIFSTDFKLILTNISVKALIQFWTVLSYMAFRSLKYSHVGKENIKGKRTQIWITNIVFSLQICGFAIFGLRHHGHLRICNMRTGHLRNLRTCDWRNEHKNLRICDLRTNEKMFVPNFANMSNNQLYSKK